MKCLKFLEFRYWLQFRGKPLRQPPMVLHYYNLKEQPFGVTPDPRYLYLSPTHREALASLLYGIRGGRGFLSIVAKPGMGKTTILSELLTRLKTSARTALV